MADQAGQRRLQQFQLLDAHAEPLDDGSRHMDGQRMTATGSMVRTGGCCATGLGRESDAGTPCSGLAACRLSTVVIQLARGQIADGPDSTIVEGSRNRTQRA